MGTPRDIYGTAHGAKRVALTREAVIQECRAHHPTCYVEASTGEMITIWLRRGGTTDVIGSAWKRKNGQWYYRLLAPNDVDKRFGA